MQDIEGVKYNTYRVIEPMKTTEINSKHIYQLIKKKNIKPTRNTDKKKGNKQRKPMKITHTHNLTVTGAGAGAAASAAGITCSPLGQPRRGRPAAEAMLPASAAWHFNRGASSTNMRIAHPSNLF